MAAKTNPLKKCMSMFKIKKKMETLALEEIEKERENLKK